jgi:hypothetical protein
VAEAVLAGEPVAEQAPELAAVREAEPVVRALLEAGKAVRQVRD